MKGSSPMMDEPDFQQGCLTAVACSPTTDTWQEARPGIESKMMADSQYSRQRGPQSGTCNQMQQKFEFYFLALVFTILGLSIQTAELSFWLQGSSRSPRAITPLLWLAACGEWSDSCCL